MTTYLTRAGVVYDRQAHGGNQDEDAVNLQIPPVINIIQDETVAAGFSMASEPPATYVIDKQGILRWTFVEVDDKIRPSNDAMMRAVTPLLQSRQHEN